LTGKQMGVVQTLGMKPLGYELDEDVKVFHLIAQPIKQVIVDENKKADYDALIPKAFTKDLPKTRNKPIIQELKAWGYNGSTPGPTIEVNEGDRIRVIVKNELPEPTSVHWHGLEVPNDQDGATPTTNRPIMPGETFTYEFTLYQSGTFIYHSGFNVTKQDDYGLHGMFVIHPKEYGYTIDRDIAIFLQEWSIPFGSQDPNLESMSFNWFTFNGLAAPNIPMIRVKQGERVRIRFANVIMNSHPIHIHGYTWQVVGTEGGPIPKSAQWPGSTINVAPGETRDVEFVAWNPGLWQLHCHKLHHVMNPVADMAGIMRHGGMFTIIYVEPKDPNAPWRHPRQDLETARTIKK
jgi:manganese oxidase